MTRHRVPALLAALLAASHVSAQPASAPIVLAKSVEGVAAPHLPHLTPADVYPDDERVRAAARPCDDEVPACVARALQRLKARPAVVAVAPLADGAFFTEIVPHGVRSVATSMNVFAANAITHTWLVNGTPALILVHLDNAEIAHVLQADPARAAELPPGVDPAKLYPIIEAVQFVAARHPAAGVTRYVFREEMTVGCHACASGGRAEYAYDVDAQGRALRKVFLRFLRDE